VLLGIVLGSCTSEPPRPSSPAQAENGPAIEESTRRLERARDANPDNAEVRDALASEYYRVARKAIDAGDEARYRAYLAKAQEELLAAIRIEPGSPQPHTQMGIILAYQGDLTAAHTSFMNALRLLHKRIPRGATNDGLYYTNIAQIDLYRGDLKEARRNLDIGRKRGAPPDEIDRIETLLAWRSGDRVEATEVFAAAAEVTRGFADTWDGAPLPEKMKSFDDFCAVCCRNPSCGPHMADACKAASQTVTQREVTRETLVEEMRLERERRAKLKEIYDKQRSISIDVEPDAPTSPAEPSEKSAPKAAPDKRR
jgi:tetratricopeptide (TPR) repeat protein